MKKYLVLFFGLIIISCEGPVGPPGPPGPPGPQGPQGPPGAIGQMFERVVSFAPDHNYQKIITFPNNIIIDDTDIVQVYWLWTVNQQTDVWQPLPASIFFKDGGELKYAFDYSVFRVRLFLTGDINLTTLGPLWTKDQIFRVVILPADWVNANKVNLKDMEAVMELVDKEKVQFYRAEELKPVRQ